MNIAIYDLPMKFDFQIEFNGKFQFRKQIKCRIGYEHFQMNRETLNLELSDNRSGVFFCLLYVADEMCTVFGGKKSQQ